MVGIYYSTTQKLIEYQDSQFNSLYNSYMDKMNKLVQLNEEFEKLKQSYNYDLPKTETYVDSSSTKKTVKTSSSKKTKSKSKTKKKTSKKAKKKSSKAKTSNHSSSSGNSGSSSNKINSKKNYNDYVSARARRRTTENSQNALKRWRSKGSTRNKSEYKSKNNVKSKKPSKKSAGKTALGMTLFAWKK